MLCLPSGTPSGLRRLRKRELESLCGSGHGERKSFERVYDYDVYNDLGDDGDDLHRPVLGGKERPYPRRCRTGRPASARDPSSETKGSFWYVPRDESSMDKKMAVLTAKAVVSGVQSVVSSPGAVVEPKVGSVPLLNNSRGRSTTSEGATGSLPLGKGFFRRLVGRVVKAVATGGGRDVLNFNTVDVLREKFTLFRDEEFSRQTLAGLNPFSIQLVTEFPFASKVDPDMYGPSESAITADIIEREIKGVMIVEEAIKQRKLFILDYHDLFLPYCNKVRGLEGRTLYGSRTVFFVHEDETLQPIAIELVRPASPSRPQWKRVFTSSWDTTSSWLWELAKAQVLAQDSGHHQLISHWLRTHCSTEPYIIAAHRQLSVMHPIFRLLEPHFRHTLEINVIAREGLINAGGIIELCFAPGKYCMELSSLAYDKLWRFDMEALPADLIRRGMAVEDPAADHGLRLTIEDYPYAADGLLVWSNIKQRVSDYVSHFYKDAAAITTDHELQSWWMEVRTVGHGDKKDEPWWPVLDAHDPLIQILTTIIWVASAHHATANFAQYRYAGHLPGRPSIARRDMPYEDNDDCYAFLKDPLEVLLETFPSWSQATTLMALLDVLSSHTLEEEYLGGSASIPDVWMEDTEIGKAYKRFHERMKEIERIIEERNMDSRLKNRCGAGILPYELMKPFSEPGITGKGIPSSISL